MANFVKQKFQWFFDMSTSADSVQDIVVNAGGVEVADRLLPFFTAFKHFKLGSVKIRFVPAATLPVDPTGLSYEAGAQTVDPRDQMNPGLVRITNGEDVDVSALDMSAYYNMVVDKRWFKFGLQSGMRRTANPLYWQIGQIHQDAYPGSTVNYPLYNGETQDKFIGSVNVSSSAVYSNENYFLGGDTLGVSSGYGIFQTGHKQRMGWMPTDAVIDGTMYSGASIKGKMINNIPEIELLHIILPQAYKTKFYYRVYVEETVMFKDTVATGVINIPGTTEVTAENNYDRFIQPAVRYSDGDGWTLSSTGRAGQIHNNGDDEAI